jgi:hypothetical protein
VGRFLHVDRVRHQFIAGDIPEKLPILLSLFLTGHVMFLQSALITWIVTITLVMTGVAPFFWQAA